MFLFVYIFPCVYIHTCTRLLQRSQTQTNHPSRDTPTLTLSPSSLPHHTPSHPTPNTFASSQEPDVKKAMSSGGALTTHSQPLKSRSIISTSYIICTCIICCSVGQAVHAHTCTYVCITGGGGGGGKSWVEIFTTSWQTIKITKFSTPHKLLAIQYNTVQYM